LKDAFEGLNLEQRAVVETLDGPILVVAGAGSGKTTVISRRVAHMIRSGIRPEEIMLLTFTRASAREMIERAMKIEPAAKRVMSGTFHSVGMRLIRANHGVLGLPPAVSVLDPSDVADVMRRLMADRDDVQLESNKPRAATIAKAVSFSANTLLPLRDVIAKRYYDYVHASDFMEDLQAAYKAYKLARNLLDYDDLLHAFQALAADPDVGPALRRQCPYMLVDEHQDSNAAQVGIIYAMGGDAPNVMVVGDPAQSIYAFRGSAPATMFDFVRHWPATRVFKLETNYRSVPEILAVANAVDHSMAERFERALAPSKPSEGYTPLLVRVADPQAEASFVVQAVLAGKRDGIELKDQAILVRSIHVARLIEGELAVRRVPYRVLGGLRIDEARHVKDVVSLARVCVNPSDEPAWMRLLLLVPGVGEKKAARIAADILRNPTPQAAVGVLRAAAAKNQMALVLANALDLGLAADSDAATSIERLTARFEPLLENEYGEEWKMRRSDIEAVATIARSHSSLGDFLNVLTIDLSMERKGRTEGVDQEEAPLTVSTIHSAKGLEWSIVIVPSFIHGHMPSMYADGFDEREEELRVFYVAVTRAKSRLVFVKPAASSAGFLNSDSPFEATIRQFCTQTATAEAQNLGSMRSVSYGSEKRIAFRR
jgi:DNA helicase-2/ATP-dependent DNA helicase PcrA